VNGSLVAIAGARIVDGLGNDPVEDGVVLIEGSRIVAAGGSVDIPGDAATIDAAGLTVMPGLIDCHVHISNGPNPDPIIPLKELSTFSAIRAASFAREMLMRGITSFRDAGAVGHVSIGLQQAIDAGFVVGPRIVACGQYISMTGRDSWGKFRPEIDNSMEVQITGADEARRAAREQIRRGAKCIKLMATGLVGSDAMRGPTDQQLTEEEMRAAIEEAHNAGLHAFSHAHSAEGILNALRAGVDSIEHGSALTEEAVEIMLARGVYLVPTLSLDSLVQRAGVDGPFPQYFVERSAMIRELRRASVKLALERGVKFAMGTDCGGVPWVRHADGAAELDAMVNAGLSPLGAIVAATSNAADLLQLHETGRIAAGALADLIVVEGDPSEDVRVLQDPDRIRLVMKDGVVYRDTLSSALPLSPLVL
jgi:imidazolonepropionase-like amidohydrolase